MLDQLYEQPIVSVNDVRALIRATFPAANQLVQCRPDRGILSVIPGQMRNRRLRYDAYVRLLDEGVGG